MKLLENLNWRYATKKFDLRKIPQSDVEEILEAGRLAPTSFGWQALKFLVITNPKIREELRKHAWDQAQITDASHLIVLCTRTDVDAEYIKKFIAHTAKIKKAQVESMKNVQDMMIGSLHGKTPEQILDWNKKQTYIALGFMLFAAAQKQIDACPMEGFDVGKFDDALGLKKQNLTATVLCTIGYRADDPYAKAPKIRWDAKDI